MLDKTKPTLYLIRGVSGAGKSTFAESLKGNNTLHFEADMWFSLEGEYNFKASLLWQAHIWCKNKTRWALIKGYNVIVSNTSTTEAEVKVYQDIAKEYNANFVSLIIENRNDTMSVHDVPDAVLQRQRNRFSVKL